MKLGHLAAAFDWQASEQSRELEFAATSAGELVNLMQRPACELATLLLVSELHVKH